MSPSNDKPGGQGWHDQFGNGLEPWIVEKTGPRAFPEDDWIFEIELVELLKSLPEMQRLAIEKRLAGIPLTAVERVYLHRARPAVANWFGIDTKLRGTAPHGNTST